MESRLIEFVKNNQLIYDKTHHDYANKIKKDKIWAEFAAQINQPVHKLKMRWKTTRDRYYRLKKEKHDSRYKYFEQLTFLNDNESIGNFETIDFKESKEEPETNDDEFGSPSHCLLNSKTEKPANNDEDVQNELYEKTRSSAIMLFFQSIAMQIDEAKLSSIKLLNLQSKILTFVRREIDAEVAERINNDML